MKQCKTCYNIKDKSNYYLSRCNKEGIDNTCKECRKSRRRTRHFESINRNEKEYRLAIEKRDSERVQFELDVAAKKTRQLTQKSCTKCKTWKNHEEFHKDKNAEQGLQSGCKDCKREMIRVYMKKRRRIDSLFRLKSNLRASVGNFLKRYDNSQRTETVLGANFQHVYSHIESQFYGGMSWGNRDEWEIDHIIPISSASNEKEAVELCNYSNLQPLWRKDNRDKSDSIPLICRIK